MGRLFLVLVIMALPAMIHADQYDEELDKLRESYSQAYGSFKQLQEIYADLRGGFIKTNRGGNVPSICEGRLTSTTGVPVTVADTDGNTTVYFTPYLGNKISLYYKGEWRIYNFAETSLALAGTKANSNYDVFIYRATLGVPALELGTVWPAANSRGAGTAALTLQNGVYVKASDPTRRYVGSIRIGATANQYDDDSSASATRGIWSHCNRVRRNMRQTDATNSWSYATAAWHFSNGDNTQFNAAIVGLDEVLVRVVAKSHIRSAAKNSEGDISEGVGVDTELINSAQLMGGHANDRRFYPAVQSWAEYLGYPGAGFHKFHWIENAVGGISATFAGDDGSAATTKAQDASGILGYYNG